MKKYGWTEEEKEDAKQTLQDLINMGDPEILFRIEKGESIEDIISDAENQSILDDIADEVMAMSDEELGIPQFN